MVAWDIRPLLRAFIFSLAEVGTSLLGKLIRDTFATVAVVRLDLCIALTAITLIDLR